MVKTGQTLAMAIDSACLLRQSSSSNHKLAHRRCACTIRVIGRITGSHLSCELVGGHDLMAVMQVIVKDHTKREVVQCLKFHDT